MRVGYREASVITGGHCLGARAAEIGKEQRVAPGQSEVTPEKPWDADAGQDREEHRPDQQLQYSEASVANPFPSAPRSY